MSKLRLEDVKILGEGAQIKKAIEKKYKDIKEFHEKNNVSMALSTFRSYFSQETITSPNFKYTITMALDADYNSLHMSVTQQIKAHTQSINDNIKLYDEDEDQVMMDYLVEQCKNEEMFVELAMMYRAKAKNFYYTNRINFCIEAYEYAMIALPEREYDKKVLFSIELAYYLVCENMLEKANRRFRITEEYIYTYQNRKNLPLSNCTLYYYYYRRGIYYFNINKDATAREFFEEAKKYAEKNYEKTGAISNIGLSYYNNKRYDEALKYYYEAVNYYDESNVLATASVYNNMSELYKAIDDYTTAFEYILKALDMVAKNMDYTKLLIYTNTYVELQIKMGNKEAYNLFFNTLLEIKGKNLNKYYIIKSIKDFVLYVNDKHCLNQSIGIILELKKSTTSEGFIEGLYESLGHVTEKLYKLFGGVLNEEI